MLVFSHDWVEAQALATAALVIMSAGTVLYGAVQLRHERLYRAVSNLEKQREFFHSEKFMEARRRLARDRVGENGDLLPMDPNDPPVSAFAVLDFYEHLGLLLKKGHLEIYDVWHTFYEWMQPVYADMKEVAEGNESPWAGHYYDLRKAVHAMDAIQRERMKKKRIDQHSLWSQERIAEHYRYEIEAASNPLSERLRRAGRKTSVSS